ncbi:hypothetical protein FJT64_027404 [Amphibalanus amphitrite]|uniref:ZP domain-containing protein n=1 Tax=Amphibalanus amphitrite TaxID=1232801 RepID=A0A6A4VVA8_AMPAM|nr:hypothetical protein FJT64_027404 [Amphibalanus amphitrite]
MEARLLVLAAAGLAAGVPGAASFVYSKVYLDDPSVCNGTIHLHDGLPAVLVRLSPGQLTRPLTCSVQIEIANSPIAGGLSAVVQELSVGKFDDPNNCTSFLKTSFRAFRERCDCNRVAIVSTAGGRNDSAAAPGAGVTSDRARVVV